MTAALGDDRHAEQQRARYAGPAALLRPALAAAGLGGRPLRGRAVPVGRAPGLGLLGSRSRCWPRCGILVAPGEFYGPAGQPAHPGRAHRDRRADRRRRGPPRAPWAEQPPPARATQAQAPGEQSPAASRNASRMSQHGHTTAAGCRRLSVITRPARLPMTLDGSSLQSRDRRGCGRTYLMCPPDYFTVDYAINPWMTTGDPVDPALAMRAVGGAAGHLPRPRPHGAHSSTRCPGCPTWSSPPTAPRSIDGAVLGARFRHPRAGRRGPGLPGLVPAQRLPGRARAAARQRGRGRHPVHRPARSSPGTGSAPTPALSAELAGAVRAAGDQRCGWSTRASTTSTPRCACSTPTTAAYYPAAFDDAGAGRARRALPRADRGQGRGRRGARA